MPDQPQAPIAPVTIGGPAFLCLRADAGDTTWVTVRGDLDVDTVPKVRRVLRSAQADAATVVLDLRELDFIDTAGAQMIVAANQRARGTGGRLRVVRGFGLAWYLQISGLDHELDFADCPPMSELLGLELPRFGDTRMTA